MSAYHDSPALRAKFTAQSRFENEFPLYSITGNKIWVPRAVCPAGVSDVRVDGDKVHLPNKIGPRNEDQVRVFPEVSGLVQEGHDFIVEAPTGWGKTVLGLKVLADYGRRALIVTTKEDLLDQWHGEAQKFFGLAPEEIGIVRGDVCTAWEKPLTISLVHSISKPGRYPSWLYSYFGILLFDEVHRLGAETFSRAAGLFPARRRLGMSATPERKDGMEIVFQSHIGPVRVRAKAKLIEPKVLMYPSPWKVPVTMVRDEFGMKTQKKLQHTPGKCGHVVNMLVKNHARNAMIAQMAAASYKNGRTTILFSDRVAHLQALGALLLQAGVHGKDIGRYYGPMSKADQDRSSVKPVILATCMKMGEGTNYPWVDTCILTTPRADVIQIVGRILREHPGKKQPVVFDIVDFDSPVFTGYWHKRLAWYKKINAEVKRKDSGSLG